MLSGSIFKRISEQLDLEFVWVAAQDPGAWGSLIHWVIVLRAGEQGGIEAVPGADWSVVIDGQAFAGKTNVTVEAGTAKELASGSVFLRHDPFGEKSFDYAFSQYLNITTEDGYVGTVTGEGSGVLDPLEPDAAPILDAPQVYLGDTLRVKPQGPFGATFRLRYIFGGAEGVIGEGLTEAVDWVVPEELGAQIPNTDRGVMRILCDAFRDGVPIGRTREAAVTVLVPEEAVPVVEAFSWEDSSQAAQTGLLLQHVSRLTYSASCAGAMGSRVIRCEATVNGEPLRDLKASGEQTILVTVTDTRGRVGRYEEGISVVAYEVPWIKVSAHRCLEDGTADDTGGWAKITAAASWTWLGDRLEPLLELFVAGEPVLSQALAAQAEGLALGERVQNVTVETVVPADTEKAIAIGAVFCDGLSSTEHGIALSTAYCVMDLLYGGKGVAFGTVAKEPGFLCAMDARFTGKVILPDGTDLMERLGEVGKSAE